MMEPEHGKQRVLILQTFVVSIQYLELKLNQVFLVFPIRQSLLIKMATSLLHIWQVVKLWMIRCVKTS